MQLLAKIIAKLCND